MWRYIYANVADESSERLPRLRAQWGMTFRAAIEAIFRTHRGG